MTAQTAPDALTVVPVPPKSRRQGGRPSKARPHEGQTTIYGEVLEPAPKVLTGTDPAPDPIPLNADDPTHVAAADAGPKHRTRGPGKPKPSPLGPLLDPAGNPEGGEERSRAGGRKDRAQGEERSRAFEECFESDLEADPSEGQPEGDQSDKPKRKPPRTPAQIRARMTPKQAALHAGELLTLDAVSGLSDLSGPAQRAAVAHALTFAGNTEHTTGLDLAGCGFVDAGTMRRGTTELVRAGWLARIGRGHGKAALYRVGPEWPSGGSYGRNVSRLFVWRLVDDRIVTGTDGRMVPARLRVALTIAAAFNVGDQTPTLTLSEVARRTKSDRRKVVRPVLDGLAAAGLVLRPFDDDENDPDARRFVYGPTWEALPGFQTPTKYGPRPVATTTRHDRPPLAEPVPVPAYVPDEHPATAETRSDAAGALRRLRADLAG